MEQPSRSWGRAALDPEHISSVWTPRNGLSHSPAAPHFLSAATRKLPSSPSVLKSNIEPHGEGR